MNNGIYMFKKISISIISLLLFSAIAMSQPVMFNNSREAGNAGGKLEFNRLYKQELVYPKQSLEAGIGGKSTYRFKIDSNGGISGFTLTNSANEELDKEALRLIKLMEWLPAENGSAKVDSYIGFTVSFDPKKYKSIVKRRGYESIHLAVQPSDTSLTIFDQVDQKAKFELFDGSLNDFLTKNMRYPKEAAVREIKGTVIVSFVIEPSGMVTNIQLLQGVGGGCSEEAIRLAGLTRWKPALKDGQAVRSRMKLPVLFNMENRVKDGMNQEQRMN
jgi:TonB family protein